MVSYRATSIELCQPKLTDYEVSPAAYHFVCTVAYANDGGVEYISQMASEGREFESCTSNILEL